MSSIEELTQSVTRRAGQLVRPSEAAAVMETLGLTDRDARAADHPNLFRLADEVFGHQFADPAARRHRVEIEDRRRRESGRHFVAGEAPLSSIRWLLAGGPLREPAIFIALGDLLLLTTLWAGVAAGARASALTLAVVACSAVGGGILYGSAQWAARRAPNPPAVRDGLMAGAVAAVFVGAGVLLFWSLLVPFPVVRETAISFAVVAFAGLGGMWILQGAALALGEARWLTASLIAAIAIIVALRVVGHTGRVWSAVMGTLGGGALAFVGSLVTARTHRVAGPPSWRLSLDGARVRRLLVSVRSNALAGAALILLVLFDRILALTGKGPGRLFLFRLQPRYESGVDAALLSFVVGGATAVLAARRIAARLPNLAMRFSVRRTRAFERDLASAYRRAVTGVLIGSAVGTGAGAGLLALLRANVPRAGSDISGLSFTVLAAAGAGYALLAWTLLNVSLRARIADDGVRVPGAAAAIAVGVLLGFVLSRVIGYWTAVAGLVAAAAIVWARSTGDVAVLLRNIDYVEALAGRRPDQFPG